mgnify:CR=1 FL=1
MMTTMTRLITMFLSDDGVSREVFEAIDIFINSDDCVPRMSLESLTRLVLVLRAVDTLNLTVAEQLHILSENKDGATEENIEKDQKKKGIKMFMI